MSTSTLSSAPAGLHGQRDTASTALGAPGSVVLHETSADNGSAVSWGAIFAGAAGAAALSLVLLLLGSGLGLAAVSPWSQSGIAATTFGVAAILWATFTQVASAGLGGYLAGRLRGRWVSAPGDETYFRDTAHGFLAWAIATLATAAWLGAAASAVVGGAAQAGATVAGGAVTTVAAAGTAAATGAADGGSSGRSAGGALSDGLDYAVDTLFRSPSAAPAAASPASAAPAGAVVTGGTPAPAESSSASANATVARIFLNALRTGSLPEQDLKYAAQLVAQRTGATAPDAEKRVGDAFAQTQAKWTEAKNSAKEAADKARKATSYAALWLVVSLLVGAFVSSLTALWGGRQRDL